MPEWGSEMGWEVRGGRRYLYRNRRVHGRSVKEYLAADGPFGELMAGDLARIQRRRAEATAAVRAIRAADRDRIDGVLAAVGAANADLGTVADGILSTLGYHRHRGGEWRMRRELAGIKAAIDKIEAHKRNPAPVVQYDAPATDAEAVAVFAQARAGDAAALGRVAALIRDRGWVDWVGDLGRQATRQLIVKAAGGDPVWEAGITQKANALRRSLLGDAPTVLEKLLVRRVVNGWAAVHALELEQAVRPPAAARDRDHLDRAVSRAQRRLTSAAGELARVRRLQAPRILAQLNVAAAQTVVNATGAAAGV